MSDYYPVVLYPASLQKRPKIVSSIAPQSPPAQKANQPTLMRPDIQPVKTSNPVVAIALLLALLVSAGIVFVGWGSWLMWVGWIIGASIVVGVLVKVQSAHSTRSFSAALISLPVQSETRPIHRLQQIQTEPAMSPNQIQGRMQAQQGVSEQGFFVHLLQWFPYPDFSVCCGIEFAIPGTDQSYCADFVVYHHASKLAFDVECDEPYEGRSQAPIHCTGDRKEERRNQFFLQGNWIVVRLAESQIVRSPLSCCKLIAAIVARLSGDDRVLRSLWGVPNLERVKRWSAKDAQRMAKSQYRLLYLNSNGATFTPPARSKSTPQRQLSRSRRIQR